MFLELYKWKKSLQRWTLTVEGHIGGSVSGHDVLLVTSWSNQKFWQSFFKFWQSLWFRHTVQCPFFNLSQQTNILLFYHSFYDTPHDLQICMLFSSGSWVLDPAVCLQCAHQARHYHEEWALGEYHKEWAYCLQTEHGYSWIGIIKWMSVSPPIRLPFAVVVYPTEVLQWFFYIKKIQNLSDAQKTVKDIIFCSFFLFFFGFSSFFFLWFIKFEGHSLRKWVLLIMANRLVSIMNLLKGSETDYHVSAKSLRSITFPNLQRWHIHPPPPKRKMVVVACCWSSSAQDSSEGF